MKNLRILAQLVFVFAGFWVGTTACASNNCPTPTYIVEGTFTDLKVTTRGTVPASILETTFETLSISGKKATLSYSGPKGPGTVTLDF